jgi:hypothetical protein
MCLVLAVLKLNTRSEALGELQQQLYTIEDSKVDWQYKSKPGYIYSIGPIEWLRQTRSELILNFTNHRSLVYHFLYSPDL